MLTSRTKQSLWPLVISVSISVFAALVLTLIQLPESIFFFWPDWIALVVVFWALMEPERVGPWVAFFVACILDVLFVRTLGILGVGLAMIAFIVNRTHQQLRMMSRWQQTTLIAILLLVFKLITGWLYGLVGNFSFTSEYWYSFVGNLFVWPFCVILLEELRRVAKL